MQQRVVSRRAIGGKINRSEFAGERLLKKAYRKLEVGSRAELRLELSASSANHLHTIAPEEASLLIGEIRSNLEKPLKKLVDFMATEPEFKAIFAGTRSSVLIANLESGGCRYLLQGIKEPTLPGLTAGEHELAPLLACGLPKETIAQGMGGKVATVKTHARWIFFKYAVHSWQELAARLMLGCA